LRNFSIINVPYQCAAKALTDLLGGHMDAMFGALPVEVDQVKQGTVTALAVTGAQRSAVLPNVLTMVEPRLQGLLHLQLFRTIGVAEQAARCDQEAA
jgi:tripartite-type tricarboxylate transporter receptor subunit TctC